jgi:Nif-specific regulatory protein
LEGAADPEADIDHIRRERDLYRALLDLGVADKIETFLEQALRLIVNVTGARRGYIELTEETSGQPRWFRAHDCSGDQLQAIRSAFSRGVIAEALATGKTVATASARTASRQSSARPSAPAPPWASCTCRIGCIRDRSAKRIDRTPRCSPAIWPRWPIGS